MLENKPLGFVGQAAPSLLKDIRALNENSANNLLSKEAVSLPKGDSLSIKAKSTVQNPFEIWQPLNLSSGNMEYSTPNNLKRTEIKDYKIDDQGDTNACGTTSLTSVLNHFGVKTKDHFEVDKSIRSKRFDMFTAPGDIVSYAKSKGLNAGLKKDSNPEEVAGFIDKGVPVMALIDSGGKYDFNMHWIVITGYDRDDKGKIASFVVSDPGGGYQHTEDIKSFSARWNNIKVGTEKMPIIGGKVSLSSGYNNLIIPIAPKNKNITLPDGRVASTKGLKLPSEFDTIQGYGSRLVSKGALLIDKTLGLGEKVFKGVANWFK